MTVEDVQHAWRKAAAFCERIIFLVSETKRGFLASHSSHAFINLVYMYQWLNFRDRASEGCARVGAALLLISSSFTHTLSLTLTLSHTHFLSLYHPLPSTKLSLYLSPLSTRSSSVFGFEHKWLFLAWQNRIRYLNVLPPPPFLLQRCKVSNLPRQFETEKSCTRARHWSFQSFCRWSNAKAFEERGTQKVAAVSQVCGETKK